MPSLSKILDLADTNLALASSQADPALWLDKADAVYRTVKMLADVHQTAPGTPHRRASAGRRDVRDARKALEAA
jgi:hypothetical protein